MCEKGLSVLLLNEMQISRQHKNEHINGVKSISSLRHGLLLIVNKEVKKSGAQRHNYFTKNPERERS